MVFKNIWLINGKQWEDLLRQLNHFHAKFVVTLMQIENLCRLKRIFLKGIL